MLRQRCGLSPRRVGFWGVLSCLLVFLLVVVFRWLSCLWWSGVRSLRSVLPSLRSGCSLSGFVGGGLPSAWFVSCCGLLAAAGGCGLLLRFLARCCCWLPSPVSFRSSSVAGAGGWLSGLRFPSGCCCFAVRSVSVLPGFRRAFFSAPACRRLSAFALASVSGTRCAEAVALRLGRSAVAAAIVRDWTIYFFNWPFSPVVFIL